MEAYKQKNKDKKIKIFIRVDEQLPTGDTITKKVYLQKKDSYIKAYIRSLSTKERLTSNNVQPSNEVELTINYRKSLERKQEVYVEYKDWTYAITGIDNLDFRRTEMKITAKSVEPPSFDSVEYREDCNCK